MNTRPSTFDLRSSTFDTRSSTFDLFLVSFLVLFFELACIRWFGSMVVFLTFFTNLVLMASFLGMTVGCLAARARSFMYATIPLTLLATALAWMALGVYTSYSKVTIDVGRQDSPQQIFFGTEYRAINPGQIVIPIEVLAGVFFVLIALVFVGLGQVMGRAFQSIPDHLKAYTANIAGSLLGIVFFSAVAYLRTSPFVWFLISMALCLYFATAKSRHYAPALSEQGIKPAAAARNIQVVAAVGVLAIAGFTGWGFGVKGQTLWSPYYKIVYQPETGDIDTNNIAHQRMVPISQEGPAYVLPYLLNRDSGGKPFEDVLIIGAGSGNDVASALAHGAQHVDAVEIDPVLYGIGQTNHPDRPYSDARVAVYLDDGRSFVNKNPRKYDLIIYALVDSLVLHSGYSSLRLESFLFTEQAFREIKARLKPGGIFAMYNYYRQGWVVARLYKMAEQVFGSRPLVISMPYQETIAPQDSQKNHITFLMIGNTDAIAGALREKESFWVNSTPLSNESINAFRPKPPLLERSANALSGEGKANQIKQWRKIGAARVDTAGIDLVPTDDWPFLYLKNHAIPKLNIRGMLTVAGLSALILLAFAPVRRIHPNWQVFFLGAGFMLLETKGVVHMALLFGATWMVNSIVLFAILVMILLSNFWVLWLRPRILWPYYALLITALAANTLVPMDQFLSWSVAGRAITSCTLVYVPLFFAGVIFATVFRDSLQPDVDFGANIAGAVVGGLCEYFSMVLGFQYLLLVALGFYLLSAIFGRKWTRMMG
ncbi:MAG TPA: hypothetical protein VGQ81_14175 [Acidobacteriota bacterium]|nr:hypothetical protein [Acidobacteriota bacterium]